MIRRGPARWLLALAVLFLTGWISVGSAPLAHAASQDAFDRFDVDATLDSQGYLNVTETIVLRFGSSSGRHGLERTLITREPDDNDHDVVYRIDQVKVSSPSGVSDALDTSEQGSGRKTYLRIRVGSSDRTISAPTATYVLSYRVLGLMRSVNGVDQLYWDATGSSMPTITAASVKVTVPGGAQDVFCSVATPGSKGDCDTSRIADGGRAILRVRHPHWRSDDRRGEGRVRTGQQQQPDSGGERGRGGGAPGGVGLRRLGRCVRRHPVRRMVVRPQAFARLPVRGPATRHLPRAGPAGG